MAGTWREIQDRERVCQTLHRNLAQRDGLVLLIAFHFLCREHATQQHLSMLTF